MENNINIQFKDRLFRLLFGREEYKENILSLYNALNHSSYTNVDDIEINTIDDAVYIKMKNDVSFLIDSYLSLWEQQSSYNPNMPLRGLMYFGKLYSGYIETNSLNIYGSKLIEIPTPMYVVFYNGTSDIAPITKLRLSDSFSRKNNSAEGDFEWTATMYNLNFGKNDELLQQCLPLKGYITLTTRIRENQSSGMDVPKAVDEAVMYCIENDILKDILLKNRSEVVDMCITEYNEKAFINGIKAEGFEQGIKQGLLKGRTEGLLERSLQVYKNCIARGMSKKDALAIAEITEEDLKNISPI